MCADFDADIRFYDARDFSIISFRAFSLIYRDNGKRVNRLSRIMFVDCNKGFFEVRDLHCYEV